MHVASVPYEEHSQPAHHQAANDFLMFGVLCMHTFLCVLECRHVCCATGTMPVVRFSIRWDKNGGLQVIQEQLELRTETPRGCRPARVATEV